MDSTHIQLPLAHYRRRGNRVQEVIKAVYLSTLKMLNLNVFSLLQMSSVVRIRRKGGEVVQGCDVYIGRPCNMGGWKLPGSIWANPYKVGKDGTIEEVLNKYETYVRSRSDLMEKIKELEGKSLGCWCHPNPCHGDILVKLVKEV